MRVQEHAWFDGMHSWLRSLITVERSVIVNTGADLLEDYTWKKATPITACKYGLVKLRKHPCCIVSNLRVLVMLIVCEGQRPCPVRRRGFLVVRPSRRGEGKSSGRRCLCFTCHPLRRMLSGPTAYFMFGAQLARRYARYRTPTSWTSYPLVKMRSESRSDPACGTMTGNKW